MRETIAHEKILVYLNAIADKVTESDLLVMDIKSLRGQVAARLTKALKNKESRYELTKYICGVTSIKDVAPEMTIALDRWTRKDDDPWLPNTPSMAEATLMLYRARKDNNQTEMEL